MDQSPVRVTARGPKSKKTLKDLKVNGEEEGARSEQEEEDAESAEGPSGNQTGISEKNAAAIQKMTSDLEFDMFSDLAIGRGYDWIESNLDLATPDPLHQFSQFLNRIQVSKITAGMIVPILSFIQDPPTYDNLRPHIPAIYAAIPDARVGVTNMVLIHANQLFSDYKCYPKCLTFEYAENAKHTLLVFSQLAISAQLYGPVIAGKLHMASVMPVAPSTNTNSKAVGFHMSANGTVIEKSGGKYAEELLPVRRALHGDKGK